MCWKSRKRFHAGDFVVVRRPYVSRHAGAKSGRVGLVLGEVGGNRAGGAAPDYCVWFDGRKELSCLPGFKIEEAYP